MEDRYNFDNHISKIKHVQSLQSGLKERIADLKDRLADFEAEETNLRDTLRHAMQETGVTSHKGIEATVIVGEKPASVVIDDMDALPEGFLRVKTVSEPDKLKIKEVIESGLPVQGARLVTGLPMLTIRK